MISIIGMRARPACGQQVRPQLALDEARRVRAPVIEEAPTQAGTSSGTKRCSTRCARPGSGSRCASSRAEVTVPVVSRTWRPARSASAGSTGRIDTVSPTLAACSQISRPGGRGVRSMPRRSGSRPGTSLPRAWRTPQHSRRPGRGHGGRAPPTRAPRAFRRGTAGRPARPPRVSAAPIAGTVSCQPSRRHRDRRQAHHDAAAERLRHHHAVPGPQHPAPRGLRGAWQHRHAGQRGELGDARGGDAARPARAVRGDRDMVAAGQQGEQDAQTLGAAARGRTEHHIEREPADDGTDEASVAVAADQDVRAVRRLAPALGLAGLHPQHRHHRQPLVPERHHNRRTGGMRCHVLVALHRPARRAQREGEIEAEHPGQRRLRDGVLCQPLHAGAGSTRCGGAEGSAHRTGGVATMASAPPARSRLALGQQDDVRLRVNWRHGFVVRVAGPAFSDASPAVLRKRPPCRPILSDADAPCCYAPCERSYGVAGSSHK